MDQHRIGWQWLAGGDHIEGDSAGGLAGDGAIQETLQPCGWIHHRVIDGADAMRFLRWVVNAVEQPFVISLFG